MGTADSKYQKDASQSSTMADDPSAVLVRAPGGVTLRQLEGNNYLGRLADAPKFAGRRGGGGGCESGGSWASRREFMMRRLSSISASGTPRSGGNARFWRRTGGTGVDNETESCNSSGISNSRLSSADGSSLDPATISTASHHHQQHPQSVNLTTLLLRGFDPVEYERRTCETRRVQLQLRLQQQNRLQRPQ